MDAAHKQEFRVRDLPTRTVTLFPSRAQIVRDIKDVSLKPGANQITVVGFSPTVDENSIKVEGTGAAIISDIAVELLPNREIFQDIYPDTDEDDKSETDDDDDESDDADDDADKETPELKEVRRKIRVLADDIKRAREVVSSADSRLKILDAYGKMLDRKRGVDIDAGVEVYRTERAKVFTDHMEGSVQARELTEKMTDLSKEEAKLVRQQVKVADKARRARERAREAKRKEKAKVQRRKDEVRKEKLRVQREREKYWPRMCYTVRITLDAVAGSGSGSGSAYTPSSSRRTSIASVTELAKPAPEDTEITTEDGNDGKDGKEVALPTCDLAISYVTSSAFWSPTYDLQLSTTTNTASLCFDAQLTNTTSEAWTGCKVVLSTSQTTFSGLNDTIPTLVPWRVKLQRGYGYDAVLNSREEVSHRSSWQAQQNALVTNQKPRHELFGVGPQAMLMATRASGGGGSGANMNNLLKDIRVTARMRNASHVPTGTTNHFAGETAFGHQQQQMQQMQQQAPGASAFGQSRASGLFGSSAPVPPPPPMPRALAAPAMASISMGGPSASLKKKKGMRRYSSTTEDEDASDGEAGQADVDAGTLFDLAMPQPVPELEFQESSFEETGMTTTYDLPGVKTLKPGSTASKQRVARIAFQNVVFSHTVVAKYKPVAYLKAKLKNASKLTLLKGTAGLTLDGSFMGRTTLPRCSAGDTFPLNLGVDPAIRVAYPKPDVKRATTGLFSKEDSNAYKRSVTISNTRASAGKPVTLLVLDQVPVSEDEKLRVELQMPRGVSVGGASVPAGVGVVPSAAGRPAITATASSSSGGAKDWGTATATLKKAGEVVWDVKLNAGRTVKLDLEYDVSAPTGEGVIQC
ncbi:hypothetical protein SBRCBS47491_003228 [Sporothrix bragantina]|uniref:Mucoidy inhibitor-like protein n=1 Tax=Sporothrix bragantina TaxID=671064 RepID=A0ABP0BDL4_9PEZI